MAEMRTTNPFALTFNLPGGGGAVTDTTFNDPAQSLTLSQRFSSALNNPNVYRAMGEAAQHIAPGTVGAGLGRLGSAAIAATQAQKLTERNEQQRQQFTQALIRALGGLTPDGAPGVTKIGMDKKGSINVTLNPSQQGEGGGNVPSLNPGGVSVTPQGGVTPISPSPSVPKGVPISMSDLYPFFQRLG